MDWMRSAVCAGCLMWLFLWGPDAEIAQCLAVAVFAGITGVSIPLCNIYDLLKKGQEKNG